MTDTPETTAPVLAATSWPDNAAMILDCVRLGYLDAFDFILDPTYGRGTWWQRWTPEHGGLEYNNAYVWHDFRNLRYKDNAFNAAVFDPPYISKGRATPKLGDFDDRYGLATHAPGMKRKSPADIQADMDAGLSELVRVVKPGGLILMKCMDYVTSGKLWLGVYKTTTHALSLGLEVIDRLEHIHAPGPQPKGRPQVHARRNHSTLLVLKVPAKKQGA